MTLGERSALRRMRGEQAREAAIRAAKERIVEAAVAHIEHPECSYRADKLDEAVAAYLALLATEKPWEAD